MTWNGEWMCQHCGCQSDIRQKSCPNGCDCGTQENFHAPEHEQHQEEVEICGKVFWADPELIPLLRALNEAGLETRSHCSGHGESTPWVIIRMDNVEMIQTRTYGQYNEFLLQWRRP